MNKLLKIFIFIIIGVLQLTLMPILQIKGMFPNIVLIGVVIFAILDFDEASFNLAAAGGLVLDLAGPFIFGFNTIIFVGFSLIIKFLLKKVLPEINVLYVFLVTLFFAFIFGLLEILFLSQKFSLNIFIYSAYTSILGVIFFLILQRKMTRNQVIKL